MHRLLALFVVALPLLGAQCNSNEDVCTPLRLEGDGIVIDYFDEIGTVELGQVAPGSEIVLSFDVNDFGYDYHGVLVEASVLGDATVSPASSMFDMDGSVGRETFTVTGTAPATPDGGEVPFTWVLTIAPVSDPGCTLLGSGSRLEVIITGVSRQGGTLQIQREGAVVGTTDAIGEVAPGPQSLAYTLHALDAAIEILEVSVTGESRVSETSAVLGTGVPATLPGDGAPGSVVVTFTPEPGPFSFVLRVRWRDSIGVEVSTSVTVSGTGEGEVPDIDHVPEPYDLGQLFVAGQTGSSSFQIRNVGGAPLIVTSITPLSGTGVGPCAFTLSPQPLPIHIPAGGSSALSFTATPAAAGTFAFEFDVASNDPDEANVTFTLEGEADAADPAPEIEVQPSSAAPVPSGGTDAIGTSAISAALTRTYTVSNTGSEPLTLSTPTLSAEVNVSSVSVTTGQGGTVPAGDSTTFTVQFTVDQPGPFSFRIEMVNNDADENPYVILVAGTGDGANLEVLGTPITVSGGAVGLESTGSVSISNVGTAALSISSVSTANTVNCAAVVDPYTGGDIAPQGTGALTFTVVPTAPGPFSFQIVISSNDAIDPFTVVDVTGVAPACALDLGSATGLAVGTGDTSTALDDFSSTACGGGGVGDLAWTWTAPSAGSWAFHTGGSNFDTVIQLRDGCDSASTELSCNDDFNGSQSLLTRLMVANEVITIVVDGAAAAAGLVELNIVPVPPEDCGLVGDEDYDTFADCDDSDCAGLPACSGVPVVRDGNGVIVPSGGTVTQPTRAPGAALSYSFLIENGGGAPLILYGATVTGSTNVSGATAFTSGTVQPGFGTGLSVSGTSTGAGPVSFDLSIESSAPSSPFLFTMAVPITEDCGDTLDNDGDGDTDCLDGDCLTDPACTTPTCADIGIGAAVGLMVATGTTVGAGDDSQGSCNFYSSNDVSIEWLAPTTGTYVIDTEGSAMSDTVLYAYDGCGANPVEIDCNEDTATIGFLSEIVIDVIAGETIVFVVDGYNASVEGGFVLNIEPIPPEQCQNLNDDDFDGLTDCDDPDCVGAPNCFENCTNGVDDDGDFVVDCADLGCQTDPACADGCWDIEGGDATGVLTTGDLSGQAADFTLSCVAPGNLGDVAVHWTPPYTGTFSLVSSTANPYLDSSVAIYDSCADLLELACSSSSTQLVLPNGAVQHYMEYGYDYVFVVALEDAAQQTSFTLQINP